MSRSRDLSDLTHQLNLVISANTDTQAELRTDLGLSNVNNTADSAKPISTPQQSALNDKADLSGFTLTGPLTLAGPASNPLGAVTRQQFEEAQSGRVIDAIMLALTDEYSPIVARGYASPILGPDEGPVESFRVPHDFEVKEVRFSAMHDGTGTQGLPEAYPLVFATSSLVYDDETENWVKHFGRSLTTGRHLSFSPFASRGLNFSPATLAAIEAACWSPSLKRFVAVGERIYTSDKSGFMWTEAPSYSIGVGAKLNSVCWSPELNLFVAVGDSIVVSSDGFTWSTASSPANHTYRSVIWSAYFGLFVAVTAFAPASGHYILTSSNGTDWTPMVASGEKAFKGMGYSPELKVFVAVSSDGLFNNLLVGYDGDGGGSPNLLWYSHEIAQYSGWQTICWSPKLKIFCAVRDAPSDGSAFIATSRDSSNWEVIPTEFDQGWNFPSPKIFWVDLIEAFYIVYPSGEALYSTDGITWNYTWDNYTSSGLVSTPDFTLFVPADTSEELTFRSVDTTPKKVRGCTASVKLTERLVLPQGSILSAFPDIGPGQGEFSVYSAVNGVKMSLIGYYLNEPVSPVVEHPSVPSFTFVAGSDSNGFVGYDAALEVGSVTEFTFSLASGLLHCSFDSGLNGVTILFKGDLFLLMGGGNVNLLINGETFGQGSFGSTPDSTILSLGQPATQVWPILILKSGGSFTGFVDGETYTLTLTGLENLATYFKNLEK